MDEVLGGPQRPVLGGVQSKRLFLPLRRQQVHANSFDREAASGDSTFRGAAARALHQCAGDRKPGFYWQSFPI